MRRILLIAALACAPAFAQTPEYNWIAPADPRLEINGLPWFGENGGEWFRLPVRLKGVLRKEVWSLGESPSGGRIRFRTDSNRLAIRLEYPSPPNMANMHAFGQTGVDLYIDGIYRSTATAPRDLKPGATTEYTYFDLPAGARRVEREMTLYLSLYKPVKVLAIGVDKEARLSRAEPFRVPKPVVFYGTSITQGGCASRPGMSYQAILGRLLNLDFVNLGFSGNGRGEPEVARMTAEIDASAFVLDFSQNNRTVESLIEVYDPFISTLRAKHPTTPIIAVTPIVSASERVGSGRRPLNAMRAHIRSVVNKRIAAGDKRLLLVEGLGLIGPDEVDGFVDGVHPNDLGFQWMAERLAPRVRAALQLPDRPAPVVYEGRQGPGRGKHIVFVVGDQEYRSEESMPMMARLLAEHHGFKCTVLLPVNRRTGRYDPETIDNIPGLEALRQADLMVLFARWLELPDEQMKEIVDYTNSGRPIVGLRTSTHPFNYRKNLSSPYAKYSFRDKTFEGGYGRQVFGETWINHYGVHQKESTRGVIVPDMAKHPILKGVKDIWGESDVYELTALAGDCRPLVMGQVLSSMDPASPPNPAKKQVPVAWVKSYTGDSGKKARVFMTTMGHVGDFKNEGFRRLVVNGCYWAAGLEKRIQPAASVSIPSAYDPNPIGIGKQKRDLTPLL
jgi:type 1 glutamine amidotransferase